MIGLGDVNCVLEKHKKYGSLYKPNTEYWGFGIEHETYLESSQQKTVSGCIIQTCRKPERYSVNYYKSYKEDMLNIALEKYTHQQETFSLPILINSHSFTECDAFGKNRTTYSKVPRPHPEFCGKVLFEELQQKDSYFTDKYTDEFIFDGDTFEFTTVNFYNANVADVLDELNEYEQRFVNNLNRLSTDIPVLKPHLPLSLMGGKNYPFAFHLTNITNPAMFNNGTIHINITLPTMLDEQCKISNMNNFIEKHRIFARIFQWFEPLLISVYGSRDILSTVHDSFAKGSQRLAVSRYIGIGTFDTDTMPTGKILTVPRNTVKSEWFDELFEKNAYTCFEQIGLDINFNKHYSHGLEFRIFDALYKDNLMKVCKEIIYMADLSLKMKMVDNPCNDILWKEMAAECLMEGSHAYIRVDQQERLYSVLGLKEKIEKPELAVKVYVNIMDMLGVITYGGVCRQRFLKEEAAVPTVVPVVVAPKKKWWQSACFGCFE